VEFMGFVEFVEFVEVIETRDWRLEVVRWFDS
jgi:hypothetical protein